MRWLGWIIAGWSLMSLSAYKAQKTEEYILWSSDRPLSWTDYKGKAAVTQPGISAVSHLVLFPSYSYDRNGVKYKVECRFIPAKSWVKATSRSNMDLLRHEQGHFDLAEYHARILRRALSQSRLTSENVHDRVALLTDSVTRLDDERQALYDLETELGRNIEKQHSWSQVINRDLELLSEYALPQ